jgi:hypothetical protein
MSDFNSSLPVRTEQDGDVVVKLGDALVPSQQLTVNPDGSVNITDNAGSLTVDAVDLDIRDLAFATDSVDVSGSDITATVTATDFDIRDLVFATDKVDVSGSAVTVSSTDLDIRDLVFATDKVDVSGSVIALDAATLAALESVTVSATDLDIRDLAFATDKVDVSGSDITATVTATDLDIRDLSSATDSVAIADAAGVPLVINSDGSLNVVVQEDIGTETVNFSVATAVAGGATSNHDLVFASASRLYQVLGSASGKLKVEVQIETGAATGVFSTICVRFNSTANPDCDMTLSKYAVIPAGARVRVIRTNRDVQPQDVYSTIVAILG